MNERLRVLVVDDDLTTLTIVQARLEASGFDVSTRDEALGTSTQILRDCPDLVLLDVGMPGLSGDELAKLIVKNGTAVILHSGEDAETLQGYAAKAGALGYIVKSSDGDRFLAEFRRLAEKHRATT